MSLNTEFGITLRTKGIDEALKKLNAVGKQADKATSAGQRFEKMWSGLSTAGVRFEKNWGNLSTMMAGLETQMGRLIGASNSVTRQLNDNIKEAKAGMVQLANVRIPGYEPPSLNYQERLQKKAQNDYEDAQYKAAGAQYNKKFGYESKSVEKRVISRTDRNLDYLYNIADDVVIGVIGATLKNPALMRKAIDGALEDTAKHIYNYEIPSKHWAETSWDLKQDTESLKIDAKYPEKKEKDFKALSLEATQFGAATSVLITVAGKQKALDRFNAMHPDVIDKSGNTAENIGKAKEWYSKETDKRLNEYSDAEYKINNQLGTHLRNLNAKKDLYIGEYDPDDPKWNAELSADMQELIKGTDEIFKTLGSHARLSNTESYAAIKDDLGKWIKTLFARDGISKHKDKIGVFGLLETAHKDLEHANNEFDESLTERTNMMAQATQEQVQINQDGTAEILDSWNATFDGWEEGYKTPLEGVQTYTHGLGIEIEALGVATQTSSKELVNANQEAQKSQEELSKSVTEGTQEALTSSLDQYTTYNDGLIDLYHDGYDSFIDFKDQETQIVEEQTGEQTRIVDQATQEQAQIQESGTVSMLKSWADMTQGWDQIATDALQGIQQTLQQTFYNAFSGVGDAWDNLWDGMKNIAYQVLASIATKMATGLIANIGLNFIGGISGASASGGATGGAGSLFNLASMGNSAYNMFGSNGISSFGTYGGMGSSLFTYGTDAGIMSPSIGGFAGAPQGMGLSALGYGVAGIGGAFTGYNLSYQLYGKNTGAQVGGTLGGAGGAMLGAKIGMAAGPWGALVGAIIGGLVGGAGGGGIGSLFGGGEPDTEDREADAERAYKIMQDLNEKANLDEDVDVDKYLEAINAAHRSDNRVDSEAMWALYNNLKSKDKLPWWAGDPGQIAHTQNLGATEWGQPEWMRYRLTGHDLKGETGDSGMIEWFGGAGEGAWGGEGNWDRVKEQLDTLDNETLNSLGEGLFNVKEGAAAFGVDLTELMSKFELSQLESGEWATILKDELTPASLMAAMNDQLRAEGMNNLEIAAQKQAAAIDSLLGSFNMSEEDTDSWIDQLFKANAEQADLSAKMEEYQDIVEQLKNVKAGEEEKTKELIARGRQLREELGLGESAFSKIEDGFEKFVESMEKIAERLINAAGGDGENSHHGGMIYHSGGMVGAMLRAGLITPHGGSAYMHSGGLRPDERMAILQAGEFVIQRSSVNSDTLATLRSINATGRLPVDQLNQAMTRINDFPQFHTGGPVAPLPAAYPAPQPQGGDSGKPVSITFNPQITVNAETGADSVKIEAAVNRALEKSRVALKRQLEQTGYQVVDAQ